eukprot:9181-Heterococcus_DN1.PRE.1
MDLGVLCSEHTGACSAVHSQAGVLTVFVQRLFLIAHIFALQHAVAAISLCKDSTNNQVNPLCMLQSSASTTLQYAIFAQLHSRAAGKDFVARSSLAHRSLSLHVYHVLLLSQIYSNPTTSSRLRRSPVFRHHGEIYGL